MRPVVALWVWVLIGVIVGVACVALVIVVVCAQRRKRARMAMNSQSIDLRVTTQESANESQVTAISNQGTINSESEHYGRIDRSIKANDDGYGWGGISL